MKKLNLNSTSVLNRKFGIELSGYNATEVDQFLDKVLEDYVEYEFLIKASESALDEKTKLINDKDEIIEKMKLEIANLKEQVEKTGRATNGALLEEMRSLKKEMNELRNIK